MYCTQCGTQMPDDLSFCTNCGSPLAKPEVGNAEPRATEVIEPSKPAAAEYSVTAMVEPGIAAAVKPPAADAVEPRITPEVEPSTPAAAEPRITPAVEFLEPEPSGSFESPQSAWVPVEPSKKKPSRGAIIGIAAAVVVLVAALVVGAIVLVNQSNSQPQQPNEGATSGTVVTKEEDDEADRQPDLQSKPDSASPDASAKPDDEKTSDKTPKAEPQSEYVLPDSATRYYTESELSGLSLWDLYVARNEIFARYGRGFKSEDLKSYFESKSWYHQRYSPEEFDTMASPLNDYELKNAELIRSVEESRGSQYLAVK